MSSKIAFRIAASGLLAFCFAFVAADAYAQTGACATVVPGQALPDLVVDPVRLSADIVVSTEKFNQTECAVVEGFVTSRGSHQLLRFTSSTPNLGADLYIGDPNQCPNLFEQSACHNHLHFHEYADYRLWTKAGYDLWTTNRILTEPANSGVNAMLLNDAVNRGDLLQGRKMGFCMIDSAKYLPDAPATKKYTLCGSPTAAGNQGVQYGWTDIYSQDLDGQYIQIDNLKDGIYVLEVQVNAEWLLPESNYTNNSSAVTFKFVAKHGKTPPQVILQ